MHRTLAGAVTLAAAGLASAPADAGVVERRPVVEPGALVYRDELEFDDGFSVTELDAAGGTELVFERTSGTQPLRALDPRAWPRATT